MIVPDVTIVIPTLDGGPPFDRCLAAIKAHTPRHLAEVVVLNSLGVVRGHTGPLNQAMAAGRGKYLVALNDDVQVAPFWLEYLLVLAERGEWYVTPNMHHTDGHQVYAPYCMLVSRVAWDALGGFDEQLRYWGADIDFARRLIEAGHPPLRVTLPHSITHEGSVGRYTESMGLAVVCQEDMRRYQLKWGCTAEEDKHRMAEGVVP